MALRACCLYDLLEPAHQARGVGVFVERLDLSAPHAVIRLVEGGAGHSAADPRILLALWLYATLRGVGSAREVARVWADHVPYQSLCGGVGMNHHTLADFRTRHMAWLDATLTAPVAILLHQGVVTLDRLAQVVPVGVVEEAVIATMAVIVMVLARVGLLRPTSPGPWISHDDR